MAVEVEVVRMEGLVVGPDEVLVLRLPSDSMPPDEEVEPMLAAFHEAMMEKLGHDRYVILLGDIEVGKVATHADAAPIPADYADSAE